MKVRGPIFIFAALAVVMTACQVSQASEKPSLHFAGLAYTGSYEFLKSNFSHTIDIDKDGALSNRLYESIEAQDSEYYNVKFGMADLNKGENLVMAIAMDREFISREVYRFSGQLKTRVIADITLQVLIINFKSLVIEGTYPMSFSYEDLLDGDVTLCEQYKSELFNKLYFSGDGKTASVVDQIVELALAIDPTKSSRTRVALEKVNIADGAAALLPAGRNAEQLDHFVGSVFTSELARQVDVEVVPYSRDYAVGNQMSARFSNGEVYSLKLPKPNLSIQLDINKLVKVSEKEGLVYAAIADMRIKSSIQGKVFVDDTFRDWVRKYDGEQIEDWPAYEESMKRLFKNLTAQLNQPDKKWLTEHARESNKTLKAFKNVRNYF